MSSSGVNLDKYLIPLNEINRATDNFSREKYIGGGGFGSVYKGELSEQWQNHTVAVKRLDAGSHQGESEFRNELEVISKFHHKNIIAFIGYCDEGCEKIIVYEHASNGSLDHHLEYPDTMSCITWQQRLEICLGAARGLHYLHSGLGERHSVIHRDVKSANILLDANMVAKICDFGLSKLGTTDQINTQVYTKVAGTHSYLDPTYLESGILRKESDVYSFGVVLFEVVSGMLVYRERGIGNARKSLMNVVRRYHHNEPDELIDPCIRDQINSCSFVAFKEIAYQCIGFKLTERPTLDTVIKKLEVALNIQMYDHSASTPADVSMIESIIGSLNSVNPYDQRIASREIALLTNHCDKNRVAFGQAGAIPLLTRLLTAPESQTQEDAFTALYNLSFYKDNKGNIISSGAVPGIVHVLEKGSNVARENAAAAICNISCIDGTEGTIGSAGAIPPLVLLLSKGTTTGQKTAACSLNNLCFNNDNKGRAVRAGLVPILMELLTQPQGVLKEESLSLLSTLSEHPEGRLAIGEAEAVPHLVELIGTGSPDYQEAAVAILVELCCVDKKYLVEAQEHGVMGKLKDVRQHGTDRGKSIGRELRRRIKDHYHVDYGSDTEICKHASTPHADRSMIESLSVKLNSVSPYDQRIASGEIALLTDDCRENCLAFAQAGAIPRLTQLLTSPDSRTQEHAITALAHLSSNYNNTHIILSSGPIPGIVHLLVKGSNKAREKAADAIRDLSYINYEAKISFGSAGAIPPLVLLLSKGNMTGKKNIVDSLSNLCLIDDSKGSAVRAGLVPILMKLLTEPQGVLKKESLSLLSKLSEHPEGRLAIGKAEAVPHLVKVIGSECKPEYCNCKSFAVQVLIELCSLDQKYLVEAQEHGVMRKLKDLQHRKYTEGGPEARELRRIIKDHQHVDYGSDTEVEMLRPNSRDLCLIAIARRGALQIFLIYVKITNCSCIR